MQIAQVRPLVAGVDLRVDEEVVCLGGEAAGAGKGGTCAFFGGGGRGRAYRRGRDLEEFEELDGELGRVGARGQADGDGGRAGGAQDGEDGGVEGEGLAGAGTSCELQ